MAWRLSDDTPLYKPMIAQIPVAYKPHWVNHIIQTYIWAYVEYK